MRIFGPFWDAPVCDGAVPVPTPVGTACYGCGEPIRVESQGFLLAGPTGDEAAHRVCFVAEMVGSLTMARMLCAEPYPLQA
jgi:hypothetical protein